MTEIVMPDIPRIYTAVAEWLSCMVFILLLERRYKWWQTGIIAALVYPALVEFLTRTYNVPLCLWIPCMLAAGSAMILFIYVCCRVERMDAICYGVIAFAGAEFTASLEWQVSCFLSRDVVLNRLQARLLVFVMYNAVSLVLYLILRPHIRKSGRLHATRRECVSIFIIAAAVFAVSNMSYLSIDTPFSSDYGFQIGNIRTMVDAAGIAILYGQLIQFNERRVKRELETVQSVLQNQYLQYQQSKESIELINYKYHDLKHQIAYLKGEEDAGKRTELLDRMEEEIRRYDAQNKTGNKVLDTILTAKTLTCARQGITVTCVADGTLLDFMDTMDICSIFGNALDNAIEAEQKIDDPEKRLIHVTVSRQKSFLLLRFENYYEQPLSYHRGDLTTTKKEKAMHGYGIKSIRYTVNKYHGAVSIATEDNWFDLKILIPMAEK